MKKVLFTSRRPLGRCENITAVYNAYDGPKDFIQESWIKADPDPRITSGEFQVMVCDEFVPYSPGALIMIEHGISGGKSYGLDQPAPYHRPEWAKLIDYAVCTSEDTIGLTARSRGISKSKVLPLGMPRTDAYIGKKKGDGGTFLAGKRAYLFAPTFRNRHEPPMPQYDWDYIDQNLTDDEILVVKPHMVTGKLLKGEYRHIVEVSSAEPSAPYLIDCDILITDYSTILFDGHLLRKPVVLFEKKKGFAEKRGMYFQYPEGYASRYVTTEAELLACLRGSTEQRETDLQCLERACSACDGHSTERVVDLIKKAVRTKVLVAVPTFENIYPDTYRSIYELDKGGNEVVFDFVRGYDCAAARNRIAQKAMDTRADYVLMVDNDVVLPRDVLLNMLEDPKDVCLGYYAHRDANNLYSGKVCICKPGETDYTMLYSAEELGEMRRRFEYKLQVHGGGMGCALIKTDVFRRIKYPWYRWVNYEGKARNSLSEDLFFCEQCHAAGIPVYVDTRAACGHMLRHVQWPVYTKGDAMYKVLMMFDDLQDKVPTPSGALPWRYHPGDAYPRKGVEPSAERIAELAGANNARGIPLIEEIPEEKTSRRRR